MRTTTRLIFQFFCFCYFYEEIAPNIIDIASVVANIPADLVTVVCCFGPKCSGKSTLLRSVFEKSSEIASSDEGFSISFDESKNKVIIESDTDDFLSEESLVAAGGSDVVIYNAPLSTLTRDGLLGMKPFFEEICNLFSKDQLDTEKQKKLLVVVRDVDSPEFEKIIAAKLPSLLQQTWDDVAKPVKATTLKFSDVFELVIAPLPNSLQNSQQFSGYVQALAENINRVPTESAKLTADIFKSLQNSVIIKETEADFETVAEAFAIDKVLEETLNIYKELSLPLNADPEVNETFGADCDEIITDMLEYFDENASDYKASAAFAMKRKELLNAMLRDMQDKHLIQLGKLRVAAFDVFRQKLSTVRITATVANEMEAALSEADKYFETTAKKLINKHAKFEHIGARTSLKEAMHEFSTERLQQAKLSGSFIISKDRKPVAVSFAWLLPHPFGAEARRSPLELRSEASYATTDQVDYYVTPLKGAIGRPKFSPGNPSKLIDRIGSDHPVFLGIKPSQPTVDEDIEY